MQSNGAGLLFQGLREASTLKAPSSCSFQKPDVPASRGGVRKEGLGRSWVLRLHAEACKLQWPGDGRGAERLVLDTFSPGNPDV